jgi:carbamoyl-phosphate synthase large subunit
VKEAVMPFNRFPDVDTLLGPEMKSTGEVMGINAAFGPAFAKAQLGAGQNLPTSGTVFISVEDRDKPKTLQVAQIFHDTGFAILATKGTAAFLLHHHIPAREIHKVSSGRPHVVDAIINREIHFIVNTGTGSETQRDGYQIRRAALKFSIPYATTIAGALAMAHGVAALAKGPVTVKPIQEYHTPTARKPSSRQP